MSVGTAGSFPRAPNLIQHSWAITASSRSQLDLSRECQMSVKGSAASSRSQWGIAASSGSMMSVGTAGPQGHCRRRVNLELKMSVAPHPQRELQISVGTARLQLPAPALPDLNRELQISVGTAGPQPRALDLPGPQLRALDFADLNREL